MPTEKQIQANRRNSQKSTGPRSVEGKAASSQNALKSGIHSESHIIRGEKAADLETLRQQYYDNHHPTTPAERMLVDTLIDSEWLLRRFRTVESQLWEDGILDLGYDPTEQTILADSYRARFRHLDRLQSRINSTQRNYRNALKELKRLQSTPAVPLPAEPATEPNQPLTSSIGFVPLTPAEAPSPAARTWSGPAAAPPAPRVVD